MAKFLLIESHDPFATDDGGRFCGLAASLARAANQVTLFLTQAGVLAARAGEHTFCSPHWRVRVSRCWPTGARCASAGSPASACRPA